MSLMPKFECLPTFTRPSPDGEPPDVRILSHDNGSFTVKKGEPPTTPVSKRPKSKPAFNKQELLEFFEPLLIKWQKDIVGMYECELPERGDVIESCRIELKNYIKENGGE